MADIESVIKGLTEIVNSEWMWKKADYYAKICKDALSLLKEHGAKVMSVEEAARNAYSFYHTPDSVKPVFVQFRDETYADEALTPPWRGGVNQRALLKEPNRYGKDFIFWTDRPSPEQMKGVEWDGV